MNLSKLKNKKTVIVLIIIVVLFATLKVLKQRKAKKKASAVIVTEIQPKITDIKKYISTNGIVEPQNRIAIKPSIAGRIEKIFVEEGDKVRVGQILAYMSSMERAALLDAARSRGQDQYKYWEKTYKPIALISPIKGEIIARFFEPGQIISLADAVLALSDRLIVKADVDETDIGSIKKGQRALIILDAYPDKKIEGTVSHVSYESMIVNNVTVYKVDIILDKVPDFFRSGMSANVDILTAYREQVLTVPINTIKQKEDRKMVLVKTSKKDTEKRRVETGLSDEQNVEIISGLSLNEIVIYKSKKYSLATDKKGSMFSRPKRSKK